MQQPITGSSSGLEIARLPVDDAKGFVSYMGELIGTDHVTGWIDGTLATDLSKPAKVVAEKKFLGSIYVKIARDYRPATWNTSFPISPSEICDGTPAPFDRELDAYDAGMSVGYYLCKNGNIIAYKGYEQEHIASKYSQGPGNMVNISDALKFYDDVHEYSGKTAFVTNHGRAFIYAVDDVFDLSPKHYDRMSMQAFSKKLDSKPKRHSYYYYTSDSVSSFLASPEELASTECVRWRCA
jgi:hypothetical protein